MRVIFIQYGDYRSAYNNFISGGSETYKAQKYSVDFVYDLSKSDDFHVCVLCVNSKSFYDENITNKLRVIGVPKADRTNKYLCNILRDFKPSHIILRTPITNIISYALENNIKILPLFADYFSNKGIRSWLNNKRLANLLNNSEINVVSNHNIPASDSLARLGVDQRKIIPWDWPSLISPDQFSVKFHAGKDVQILYVRAIPEDKGPFDCIKAMDYLDYTKFNYKLKIIGSGDIQGAENLTASIKMREAVKIMGPISNDAVITEMTNSDVLIVPSRHKYPEGMPNTIYEGLITRTPLLLSDHPVFVSRFKDRKDVLFFNASQPRDIAKKIEFLFANPDLYRELSIESHNVWLKLKMPVIWGDLISKWIEGGSPISDLRMKYAIGFLD